MKDEARKAQCLKRVEASSKAAPTARAGKGGQPPRKPEGAPKTDSSAQAVPPAPAPASSGGVSVPPLPQRTL
ncbi:MAG: hypothetical protein FJX02_04695 [Alphaproteobacteria bacterium]|nr:hypothetical protein [Alphaproteobacteria bacterium]